jgi:hypothetical protein
MYARLQTTRTRPPAELAGRVEDLLDVIGSHPGFAGAWMLPPVAADAAGLLTLWQARDDAEQASDRTAAARGERPVELTIDTVYRVVSDQAGSSPEGDPAYAQLTYFDAPRSPEWSEAFLRAGQERIWPAVRDLPGTVRALTLVADSGAHLQVGLVTGVDVVEQLQDRIMSTSLLPWEDPALLTGPDRVALHRVAAVRLPAGASA